MSTSAQLDADPDEDQDDLMEVQEALAEIEKEGTVSWEHVKADLGI